jgi:hypothetical protein
MYVVRGLQQALLMLVGTALVALAVAALWAIAGDGEFRPAFAIALMVLAALLSFTGGNVVSRAVTLDAAAFLGRGPDREDAASGAALTPVGVFLFVSIPLFLTGGLLYG